MKFDLHEVINISEHVRVESQSRPTVRTKVFVDEYLETKKAFKYKKCY